MSSISLPLGRRPLSTIVLAATLLGCFVSEPAAAKAAVIEDFYSAPANEIPGPPGTLLRIQQVPPPAGAASAYRILYRSRGEAGEPVAVSGVVAIPGGEDQRRRRGIVTWGHGTTGIGPACAPSRAPTGDFAAINGLRGLLANGDVVVATDYQGLGAGNGHPYLAGVSEAHAMIDAARAARHVPGADAGRRVASWGFSEGGHASLFTGALARRYAPELDLVGVAAASAPTELSRLLRADIGSLAGKVIASYAVWSWGRAYGAPVDAVVRRPAIPGVARIASTCSLNAGDDLALGVTALGFNSTGLLTKDAVAKPAWQRLIARNSVPMPRSPVFLAQGAADHIVDVQTTRDYVAHLTRTGTRITYYEVAGASHSQTVETATPAAVKWINDRLDQRRAADR